MDLFLFGGRAQRLHQDEGESRKSCENLIPGGAFLPGEFIAPVVEPFRLPAISQAEEIYL